MADKREKNSRKPSKFSNVEINQESYRNTEQEIGLPPGPKTIDEGMTSWSCHFKNRYLGDPLRSKLILQIGF